VPRPPSFWSWFLLGPGRPGWRKFADRWLFLHIGVGLTLARAVSSDLRTAASTVLLPLVGVLIGLSFAWAGNAQALLQTEEVEELSGHHPRGFVEYVFTYQAAIFTILTSVVVWGLAGLGIFEGPHLASKFRYSAVETILYTISSLTIRECWHVVLGAQELLLARYRIRQQDRLNTNKSAAPTETASAPD
jgi:hypothetical protein